MSWLLSSLAVEVTNNNKCISSSGAVVVNSGCRAIKSLCCNSSSCSWICVTCSSDEVATTISRVHDDIVSTDSQSVCRISINVDGESSRRCRSSRRIYVNGSVTTSSFPPVNSISRTCASDSASQLQETSDTLVAISFNQVGHDEVLSGFHEICKSRVLFWGQPQVSSGLVYCGLACFNISHFVSVLDVESHFRAVCSKKLRNLLCQRVCLV